MGLTKNSVGYMAADRKAAVQKHDANDRVIALAGNPNVGKSTLFNALTGMNQHTGNWPGKTVTNAQGYCKTDAHGYVFVDIPGTYSLLAHSAEEEVARNFICFGEPDAVVAVCDATCLERNLNLVLQILEATPNVVVCVNLIDEAKRKKIHIDKKALEQQLGVPVVETVARKKKTLSAFLNALDLQTDSPKRKSALQIPYPTAVEEALLPIQKILERKDLKKLNARWLSLKLLEEDAALTAEINAYLNEDLLADRALANALQAAQTRLRQERVDSTRFADITVAASVSLAEEIGKKAVRREGKPYSAFDRRLDKILTGRLTAYPLMLLFLLGIFWLTISVSNYPSQWLSAMFAYLQDRLSDALVLLGSPAWLRSLLADGVFCVLGWVISVMLPPMAIFFPLFTLLEDAGYLPRVAYTLDRPFQCCNACGKQALTMCMGFGCNAAGVVGCRIIDSPRERLLAILTNSLVPCNGRFPALISILTIFFVGLSGGVRASFLSALWLLALILLGVFATFAVTKLLSKTLLRGMPSSFTLELPPFRKPQVGRVLVRSVLDRTVFVLGRAAAIAAPAGLLIWLMANISCGGNTLFGHCADFLNPFARLLGMDGVILMAFILGFPANEVVIPIIIMGYLANGSLTEFDSLWQMRELFTANGWTAWTAASVLIFFLFHWPCSTTLLTVKKETGSFKWTVVAAVLPTAVGILLCLMLGAVRAMCGFF